MGKFKADTGIAEAKEKRWFNWMTGFAFVAALIYLGRIGLDFWARQETRDRLAAAGGDERQLGSIQEFITQVRQTNLCAQALVTALCIAFLVTGFLWMRAVRSRKAAEKARTAR